MALKQGAGRCYLPGMVDATFDVATRADLAEVKAAITWRIIVIGLALNAATGVAVVGAMGWMLSGS